MAISDAKLLLMNRLMCSCTIALERPQTCWGQIGKIGSNCILTAVSKGERQMSILSCKHILLQCITSSLLLHKRKVRDRESRITLMIDHMESINNVVLEQDGPLKEEEALLYLSQTLPNSPGERRRIGENKEQTREHVTQSRAFWKT